MPTVPDTDFSLDAPADAQTAPPGVTTATTHPKRGALERSLEYLSTRDLLGEIEHWQWLAIRDDLAYPVESRAYAEFQIAAMVAEVERRRRLLEARQHDPLRPRWPRRDADLKRRIEAVKAAWPIARFCRRLHAADLTPMGSGRWTARCPLPDHDDATPSFSVYEDSDSWYCFGCGRGGDLIQLTGLMFGLDRFYDQLERLEREGVRR
jgi:hypothetical protein